MHYLAVTSDSSPRGCWVADAELHPLTEGPPFSKLAEFTASCQLVNDLTCFVEHNFKLPQLSQDSLLWWIACCSDMLVVWG